MADFDVAKLAIPSVCLLISFLAYSSQVLFSYLEPRPLTGVELLKFNSLVLCIWICYFRACRTNPGNVPSAWTPQDSSDGSRQEKGSEGGTARSRWCRKCDVMKPPRAHHCKACRRCVELTPSMNCTDLAIKGVFLKWIITVRGQITVFLTLPSHISFVFSSMLCRQCSISNTLSTYAVLSYGATAKCQVFVHVVDHWD